MAYYEESEGTSAFGWFLAGAVIGGVLGVLYAPKAGSELRGSLGDYARDTSDKARGIMGRISDRIPGRVKAAAGFGAVKEGGREAFREAKEGIEDRLS
jgi:gas vesicle protein